MMYGQMTAGSWIYIGTPGHRPGHLRDLRRSRHASISAATGGPLDPHRGAGRHGRRAAAGGRLRRRAVVEIECQQSRIEKRLQTRYLDKQAQRPRRRAGDDRAAHRMQGRPSPSACWATRREIVPELVRRARPADPARYRHRPDLRARPLNGYLPAGWTVAQWQAAQSDPAQHARLTQAAAESLRRARQAMLEFHAMGVPMDYGNNIRQVAKEDGVDQRLRLPRLRACLYPPAVLPRRRPVPLGGAVRRPGGHPQDRRQDEGAVPREQATCTTGWTWPASASPSRACRRASAGSAWASGTGRAWPSTRWWRAAS